MNRFYRPQMNNPFGDATVATISSASKTTTATKTYNHKMRRLRRQSWLSKSEKSKIFRGNFFAQIA